MTLTDEQLGALAERLEKMRTHWQGATPLAIKRAVAREAARWADEQQGEVVWQYEEGGWLDIRAEDADSWRDRGYPVRAIRVIATTTKEPSHG